MVIQADSVFSGISTFGRLPYKQCLGNPDVQYDIAFMGRLALAHNQVAKLISV